MLASLPEGTSTEGNLEDKFPAETNAELKKLRDAVTKLEKAPPAVSTAMAVTEREAKDLPIHIRGSHLTLGDVVPRRFPRVLAGDDQTPLPKDGSGRLELARWLTSDEHPLTSRVIANRVWRWHFGNGLVGSPDNFGIIGQEPINQPLLDWLAVSLTENGWSLKWLHKKILMSQTWQMSSQLNEHAQSVDPENQLQWRANVKRLEAEAIRDSILAVSGQLDRKMFGPGTLDQNMKRRSVYFFIKRSSLIPVMMLFDWPEHLVSIGQRTSTTVAPQALMFMNSQQGRAYAESFAATLSGKPDAIGHAYRSAIGREPNVEERQFAEAFITDQSAEYRAAKRDDADKLAMADLCQAIFSMNEFVYVD